MPKKKNVFKRLECFRSSVEAKHFNDMIMMRDFTQAKKVLMQYVDEKESDEIIKDLLEEYAKKVSIIELDLSTYNFKESDNYLAKIGTQIVPVGVLNRDGEIMLIGKGIYSKLENVTQVWKIEKQ